MNQAGPALSLSDLETFDPRGGRGAGSEGDWLCPLCGTDKPRDAAHRSLGLNRETGRWKCHRCGAAGRLKEFWEERPPRDRRTRARASLRRAFSLSPSPPSPAAADRSWLKHLTDVLPLASTPGAEYLRRRALSLELAHAAGARFAPDWFGRPAVVFPVRDQAGALVAAQGRYIDGGAPKMRSAGNVRAGVFATPGAREAPALALVEAPIDALSLALSGLPALALVGASNRPAWLPQFLAFKTVFLATDNDAPTERHPEGAGNAAAAALATWLSPLGARCVRLKPSAKDVNDALRELGGAGLAEWLRAAAGVEKQDGGQEWADEAAAYVAVTAAYEKIGQTVPAGALSWAAAAAPSLVNAADIADRRLEGACLRRDLAEVETAAAALVEAWGRIGAAFAGREG